MSIVRATSPLPTLRAPHCFRNDKAIYSYMPEIVEFYTGSKPLLQNVPTWRCSEPDSLKYVLDNIADRHQEVGVSSNYGVLVKAPTASKKERETFADKLRARERSNYRP